MSHISGITYQGILHPTRCAPITDTFPDEFVTTWVPKWMKVVTKRFRKHFEKDFSHDKAALNDESSAEREMIFRQKRGLKL